MTERQLAGVCGRHHRGSICILTDRQESGTDTRTLSLSLSLYIYIYIYTYIHIFIYLGIGSFESLFLFCEKKKEYLNLPFWFYFLAASLPFYLILSLSQ